MDFFVIIYYYFLSLFLLLKLLYISVTRFLLTQTKFFSCCCCCCFSLIHVRRSERSRKKKKKKKFLSFLRRKKSKEFNERSQNEIHMTWESFFFFLFGFLLKRGNISCFFYYLGTMIRRRQYETINRHWNMMVWLLVLLSYLIKHTRSAWEKWVEERGYMDV